MGELAKKLFERKVNSTRMKTFRGKHSTVEVRDRRAIKKFKKGLEYNFWKEVAFLSYLQPHGFVPSLYSIRPERLEVEMEFIDGVTIGEKARNGELEAKDVLSCMDICRKLDEMMIQKEEMHMPDKHIIFRDGKAYFIDFERSVIKKNPSNVTQFFSYLLKLKVADLSIMEFVREYSRKMDDESYLRLRRAVERALIVLD